jgi:hypothetical protein
VQRTTERVPATGFPVERARAGREPTAGQAAGRAGGRRRDGTGGHRRKRFTSTVAVAVQGGQPGIDLLDARTGRL